MVNQINDIASQASQGSIAAIIQVLNEKLANSGVRTRAVFDAGVLQLLCEARTKENLEKSTLVQKIKQILESIAPRNVHRVNINSRIVREQQLLWLEEINRDPENQLLWSEQITLKKPNVLKLIIRDFKENKKELQKPLLPQPQSSRHLIVGNRSKPKKSFLARMMNALGLCLILLSAGWLAYYFLGSKIQNSIETATLKYNSPNESKIKSLKPTDTNKDKLQTPVVNASPTTSQQLEDDIFYIAIRIANQAVEDRKTANTSVKWLDVAEKWQYASDLMAEVPSSHSRFKEAQSRIQLYKEYSDLAKEKANKK
ncbi:hypothetical protein [Calothrix sp. CCY 0018]|uniref:hypothetical protein n=1 Tax=Calothrix sp. CCY 0018 TaxID=3103864 RepID=UPI0039C6C642